MSGRSPILPRLPHPEAGRVATLQQAVAQQFLQNAVGVQSPNFTRIATTDLRLLFSLYDELFFGGAIASALSMSRISLRFRLAPRFTNAGGKTTFYSTPSPSAEVPAEIAISTTLLFESFQNPDETHLVAGCTCRSRVEALQRVFEHEILHLLEFHDFATSSCAGTRFRQWAHRLFGHQASDHRLLRPADRARTDRGIQVGTLVAFEFEGRMIQGVVNRITKRATVLVPSPHGMRFSDGQTYAKYYVPLSQLSLAAR